MNMVYGYLVGGRQLRNLSLGKLNVEEISVRK